MKYIKSLNEFYRFNQDIFSKNGYGYIDTLTKFSAENLYKKLKDKNYNVEIYNHGGNVYDYTLKIEIKSIPNKKEFGLFVSDFFKADLVNKNDEKVSVTGKI